MRSISATLPTRSGRGPFFVIGSPRSGTTLLRLLLTCHRRIVIPPECGFIVWLHPHFGQWNSKQFADPDCIASFVRAVSGCRKFETWRMDPRLIAESLNRAPVDDYAQACARLYELYCQKQHKPDALFGDKNNFYLGHIPELARMYSEARFLHIVRDGRDIACSYREVMQSAGPSPYRPTLPTALGEIAELWATDVQTVARAFEERPPEVVCTIRYEDLTEDPTRELRGVCRWLGVEFDPAMLLFHQINAAEQLEPPQTMPWKARTLAPVSSATVGRFEHALTPGEITEFQRLAGPQLEAFGYKLHSDS